MDLKKKRVMTYYIEAAQEIINEYGVEEISIRKIAEKTGYNSATLYNYFKNLEILLLYASIAYLKNYIIELKERTKAVKDPREKYIKVYEVFNKYAFQQPDIYFNMFYGPNAKYLPDIIENYYEIYPEELEDIEDEDIYNMLTEGDIYRRDLKVTKSFVKNKLMDSEDVDFLVNTVVRVHLSYLYNMIYHRNSDIEEDSKSFIRFMNKIMDSLCKERNHYD